MTDGEIRPLFTRDRLQFPQRQHPGDLAVRHDRKPAKSKLQKVSVDRLIERLVRLKRHDLRRHDIADSKPGQGFLECHLAMAVLRRGKEKAADQQEPHASHGGPCRHIVQPDHHQQDRKSLSRARGVTRCLVKVVRPRPDAGSEHPASIQGISGYQIECGQDKVDVHQILGNGHHAGRCAGKHGSAPEPQRNQHRDQRTCDGNQELCLRGRRLTFDLCHAAENEQGDLRDRDTVPQCDYAMAELMHQDRDEKQEGRNDSQDPVLPHGHVAEHRREISLRQRPGEERKNNEPGHMDPQRYPKNAPDLPGLTHHPLPYLPLSNL